MPFRPDDKVVVKAGYEVWDREAHGLMRKVLKDGQVVTVINYDTEKGGYNCKTNGEEVFIPEDWLTDFDER